MRQHTLATCAITFGWHILVSLWGFHPIFCLSVTAELAIQYCKGQGKEDAPIGRVQAGPYRPGVLPSKPQHCLPSGQGPNYLFHDESRQRSCSCCVCPSCKHGELAVMGRDVDVLKKPFRQRHRVPWLWVTLAQFWVWARFNGTKWLLRVWVLSPSYGHVRFQCEHAGWKFCKLHEKACSFLFTHLHTSVTYTCKRIYTNTST